MADRATDWTAAVTFVPADPPRQSSLALWRPGAATGLFADTGADTDTGVGAAARTGGGIESTTIDVIVPRGERWGRESVTATTVPMRTAIGELADLGASASPSARLWARSTQLALHLISRGHLIPAVTTDGWDAWQVDPLEPGDHAVLDALVAACPPEAIALAANSGRLAVVDPWWLIRCHLDAVADAFVRTAAAPAVVRTHLFAAPERTPAGPLRAWVASAFGHLHGATRLGVRVELVDDRSDDPSRGRFDAVLQLRSTHDPSLVVDAEQLVDTPAALRARLGSGASSELLVALGRAALVWPVLDRALDDDLPGRVPLDLDDIESLIDAAEALEATGVEVLWPASFVADLRPRLVAGAPPAAVADEPLVGLGTILDFRWEVLCDGSPLSDAELDALADAKRNVVWLRGRWVRTDPDVLRRIRQVPAGLDGPSGLAVALAGEMVDADGVVVEVVASGLVETVRTRLGELAGVREAPEPPGLAATLRPYQRRGVAWMSDLCRAGLGGVLADDMGLGKTVQVIALHLALSSGEPSGASPSGQPSVAGGSGGPMLVVCPTSVLGNWAREIARFAPGVPVRRLAGADRDLGGLASDEIVLVTYGVMRRMVDDLAEVEWAVVVADEAQTIKNPRARTSRAIRRIPAGARLALTGTPVENRLTELWALLDWTTPGLLGSADHFRTEFAVPIERHGNRRRAERLSMLTKPFMLRRRKTDDGVATDLPSRTQHDVVVPLSAEQLSMYEALVRESLFQINGSEGATRVGMVFRLLTALKQIANHPGQYLHEADGPLDARSGKLDATVDLVTAAVEGEERVLVFSQYVEMCHLLRRRFGEIGVDAEVLHGGLSADARDRLVERFQAGDIPVLVISLKAGGTGLNLTAATQVVHFDRWWNPAVEDQATDRAWRIGQTRPVVVHRMIAEGTIDERIAEMIERKRALAERVVGGNSETWIADLDDAALADLVTLRSGAHFREGVLL